MCVRDGVCGAVMNVLMNAEHMPDKTVHLLYQSSNCSFLFFFFF